MSDEQIVDMQAEYDVLTRELEAARECHVEQLVRANALAAIVRELAERGPFVDMPYCADCYAEGDMVPISNPANRLRDSAHHEPDCLWRRAKVLYPEPTP
jgi:hypothetical protein